MSPAVSRIQIWVRTRMPGYSLNYRYTKGTKVAAHPPGGGPAETGSLSASNLRLILIPHPLRMPDGPAKAGEVYIYIYIYTFTVIIFPGGWGCRIHRLLLCRGVRHPPNDCPGYDTKQSDGEVPAMLELWEMRSTSSLPSLPGPLWPGVVAPDRALSMG